jgi:hypothetical protein
MHRLVASLRYKPGWSFKIAGPHSRYLCVFATTPDSHSPTRERCTQHQFQLLDDYKDERAFYRWVFDCLLLCELHEAGEFFTANGHRPFYPNHQDEGSPYELVERWET